jgi:heat shock protein HtpX
MQSPRVSFHDQISRNNYQSFFLVLVVAIVLIGLVYSIGMAIGEGIVFISIFGVLITLVYLLVGYYASSKIALASVSAKPASPASYPQYNHIMEGLCLASGIPKPKLYVMENSQINAFATGRNYQNAVVCVTTGALEKLNKQELEGVLSHELSHIANYDIRFMTLVAGLVGMISIIAEIFLRSLWWNSLGGGKNRNNGGKSGAIFLIVGIILAVIAPILVSLVQLAISRKREYMADASAVKFTRSPTGLIGALEKIKQNSEMKVSGAIAPLFIAKPSRAKELFSTHPSLERRIEILKRM